MRKPLLEGLIEWAKHQGVDFPDHRFLGDSLEDLLLPTIVTHFYNKKAKSFSDFVSEGHFFEINELHPNLQSLLKNFLKEVDRSFHYGKALTKSENFLILGDPHRANDMRYKFRDGIYFENKLYYSEFLNAFLKKLFPQLQESFPPHQASSNYIKRTFIRVQEESNNEKELRRYYYNLGQVTVILFALRAIDINAENLVVKMPFPIVFDLECLFTNQIGEVDDYGIESTGIVKINEDFDMSALSGGRKPVKSYLKPIISGTESEPIIKWSAQSKGIYYNIPMLKGVKVDYNGYMKEVVTGMKFGFEVIKDNREYVCDLVKKIKVGTRTILAPTKLYKIILQSYTFPQVYQQKTMEEHAKEELKDRETIHTLSTTEGLLQDEVESLSMGLIPKYHSEIHSEEVLNSESHVVAKFSFTQGEAWLKYFEAWEKHFRDALNFIEDLD